MTFVSLAFLTPNLKSYAAVNPDTDWKVWSLKNFDLIYDAKQQGLADIIAARLVTYDQLLSAYFQEFPNKVAIVINDSTDVTNGFASPFPYQMIMLYPTLPSIQDSISDYQDWFHELAIHEYAHILSFEPRNGIFKVLNSVFGSIATPNMLLPRWFLEGVAVEVETKESAGGRLRSASQDAYARALTLDSKWSNFTVADINESGSTEYPFGANPYIFGSWMWSYWNNKYSKEFSKKLHTRYSERVPYFLEAPLEELTEDGFAKNFSDAKSDLNHRAEKQIQQLKALPTTSVSTLLHNDIESLQGSISPDGKLLATLNRKDNLKKQIRIYSRPSYEAAWVIDESYKKLPSGNVQRISWSPDSEALFYDRIMTINEFNERSDFFKYNLKNNKNTRLTKNLGGRELDINADQSRVVFVKLSPGRTDLALGFIKQDEDGDETISDVRILYAGNFQTRISFPTFINAHQIIFSERESVKNTPAQEKLWLFDLNTLSKKQILSSYKNTRFVKPWQDKVLFTSDQNGVPNIYVSQEPFDTARPVSHTLTSMTQPFGEPEGLRIYATELTSRGNNIVSFEPSSQLTAELPKVKSLLEDRYDKPFFNPAHSVSSETISDYSPWSYLIPRYWLPSIYFTNDRSVTGFQTSASDPLGKHSYAVYSAFDSALARPQTSFSYLNQSTPVLIQSIYLDTSASTYFTNLDYRRQLAQLSGSLQLSSLSTDLYISSGWIWKKRGFNFNLSSNDTEYHGPNLSAVYSNTGFSGEQVSPEGGYHLSLNHSRFLNKPNFVGFNETLFSGSYYQQAPLPEHHAIMLRHTNRYIDNNVSTEELEPSLDYATFANSSIPQFAIRGFPAATFLIKNAALSTLEYRFPIRNVNNGIGDTAPLYIKRLHGAIIADALQADAFAYSKANKSYTRVFNSETFSSLGAEVKADITLGYHFGLTVFYGAYWPSNNPYVKESSTVIGFQLQQTLNL